MKDKRNSTYRQEPSIVFSLSLDLLAGRTISPYSEDPRGQVARQVILSFCACYVRHPKLDQQYLERPDY